MPRLQGSARLWITAALLLGTWALLHSLHHAEKIVARQPLSDLPHMLESWKGKDAPLQQSIVDAVGVTDYTNRVYLGAGGIPIQLYVGYYASQRAGDSIHSPKNCLPGSGWDPIRSEYATIPISARSQIVVNEYLIQRDLNKQLVFYWYQSGSRVIASEYSAKFWMVADAISRNRTDGTLVRIITPVVDGEANARVRLIEFTQVLVPQLKELLPN